MSRTIDQKLDYYKQQNGSFDPLIEQIKEKLPLDPWALVRYSSTSQEFEQEIAHILESNLDLRNLHTKPHSIYKILLFVLNLNQIPLSLKQSYLDKVYMWIIYNRLKNYKSVSHVSYTINTES